MAVGFKKSLFGFNCADVIEYIEKTHKSFVQKEKEDPWSSPLFYYCYGHKASNRTYDIEKRKGCAVWQNVNVPIVQESSAIPYGGCMPDVRIFVPIRFAETLRC